MMRRVLVFVLTALLALGFTACTPNEEPPKVDDCTHQFDEKEFSYCIKEDADGESIYTVEKCKICNEQAKVSGKIVSKQTEISTAVQQVEKGGVIYFKKASYNQANVLRALDEVTFYAEDGTFIQKMNFNSENGCANVTVQGFNFNAVGAGGIIFNCAMDGVTVKDCNFEGYTRVADADSVLPEIKNLSVINCRFESISRLNKLSAIRVTTLNNFILTDCYFDDIEYNAVQIGGNEAKGLTGRVEIKGNTFKNTVSRVIHLAYNRAESVVISDNTFYDNNDCEETTGRYIHCREGKFEVGANTWEILPIFSDLDFTGASAGNVTYDESAQKILE